MTGTPYRDPKLLLIVLGAMLLTSCPRGNTNHQYCLESTESGFCRVSRVSIETILSKKDAFHGKRVKVVGYAHIGVDNKGIYPTKRDCDEWKSKRGLWLEAAAPATGSIDHRVEVEGTFDQDNTGDLGNWAGALTHIFRIKIVNPSEQNEN